MSGDVITVYPSPAFRKQHIVVNIIWMLMAGGLAFWSGSSLLAFFQEGITSGPLLLLNRFDLSSNVFLAIVIVYVAFLALFGIGGFYEIIRVLMQKDVLLLQPDQLVCRRRRILTRESRFSVQDAI